MIERLKHAARAALIGAATGGIVSWATYAPGEQFPLMILIGFTSIFAICGLAWGRHWVGWVVAFFLSVWR